MLLLLAVFWLTGFSFAQETGKPLRIAILPCNNIEITFKKFYTLLKYLQQETGLALKLEVPHNFAEFASSVRNGEIDFALQDPHTYIMLARFFNQGELLKTLNTEGGHTQAGVVVVRQDSHLKKLTDLKGKMVMFGPKASATKWVAAKWLFAENGLDIDKELKGYVNGGCCEDIAFSVYLKSVDAGVVCDHFLAEHQEKQKELGVKAAQLTVIGRTKDMPTRVFVARRGLDPNIVHKVNQALRKLDRNKPEHAKILFRGELGGFQKAKDREYDGLRKINWAEMMN